MLTSLAMYGSQPLHMVDRWTLDGSTLTIRIMTQFDQEPARTSVRVMERRPPSQWPSESNKSAEEVVTCAYCHVGAEMDKDDKVTKQTARRMIEMTNRINSREFGGRNLVTCGTCHRGSAKPA